MIKSSIVQNPSHSQVAFAPTCLDCSAPIGENEADFRNSFSELCSKDNQPHPDPLLEQG